MKLRHVPWVLLALFVLVLGVATYRGLNPTVGDPIRWFDALWAWSFIGFPVTGALIATRMPDRPLGWAFCVGPLLIMTAVTVSDAAEHGGHSAETSAWIAWASNILFSGGLGTLAFVPFLLPDGRPANDRWAILLKVMYGVAVAWALTATFAPGELGEFPQYTNPIGIESLRWFFEPLQTVMGFVMLGAILTGIASIVLRYRRAQGQERLQLKWVALGIAVVPLVFGVIATIELFADLSDAQVTGFIMGAILAVPTSIGVAMLKHRLYEIDQIINRTLVYGAVTALLVGSYLGLVVALQIALDPLTQDSDIAVAASTIAVAALFRPMRSRMQGFIDRRFYRRKYDASLTLVGFGQRLRDEVDLDVLQRDLLGVLHETMQPRAAGIWIRPNP